jgi:hypothetical protein
MNQEEKIFADGFSFKRNEKAPDFVVGRLSLKSDDAIAFIKTHSKNGWVNLSIKTARSGNHYVELDNFEPKGSSGSGKTGNTESTTKPKSSKKEVNDDDGDSELPF